MNLRKFTLTLASLVVIVSSCKKDDDSFTPIPDRDRTEVYNEDIIEIETYLSTHFFNYEEFEANPNSTDFQIVFDTIEGANADKIPLIDQVDFKLITDTNDESVEYKLYFLKVREGNGASLHSTNRAFVNYEGSTFDNEVFDSAVNPIDFNLISVGNIGGVVAGFREGLLEFNTAANSITNSDGTQSYEDYGIGAVFIPSGLGYFSQATPSIPSYSPIMFKFDLVKKAETDWDLDRIPSSTEDLDNDNNPYNDDTDGDLIPNFVDNDDDGDGVLTKDELDYETYEVNLSLGEMEPVMATNQFEIKRETVTNDEGEDILVIETYLVIDTDGDGTPDYLDDAN
ncbi:FKBP-type peptidyl-prolyl cis-trans isomerase [Lacinutrix salivirga]